MIYRCPLAPNVVVMAKSSLISVRSASATGDYSLGKNWMLLSLLVSAIEPQCGFKEKVMWTREGTGESAVFGLFPDM